tara:strand:- start:1677 stop:2486 length:810 start_codon:yes stop_codon:yes gene_type:complete
MKFRHNKKRNTFFIFEALIREMTKSTVAKNEEGKNKILLLIKEFFNKKTILAKELELYKAMLESKNLDLNTASRFLQEVKKDYSKLNLEEIFNQQTKLINKINKTISKNVFVNFVPRYKDAATIYQFFHDNDMPAKSRLVLENQVAELLMENKANKEINFPKIDNLAFKTFLQKYNSTYSKNLLSEQKELLGKYITSFADNGLPFKIFLNEEIDRLKTNLTEKIKQTPQNNLNEQLKEVLTVVDGFKKQKIDKKLVEKVLKIQNLMGEI